MGKRGILAAVAVFGLVAAACSSASSAATSAPYDYNRDNGQPYVYPSAAATYGYLNPGDKSEGGLNGPTAAPAATSGAAPQPGASGGAPQDNLPQPEDRIIKTGTIHIQVANIDTAIVQATDIFHALGGWSAGSDRSLTSAGALASVTFRVPVNRFDDALASIRKLGTKVLGEHSDSQSVGSQIVDLQARIDNLKASEKAVQAIMGKAKTIGEVLEVQQRLSEIQGQIEQLSAQLTGLTDKSAFSTLTVVFEVPAVATPTPKPTPSPTPEPTPTPVPWSAGTELGSAAGTLTDMGETGATVLIWLVVVLVPLALVLLLLLILLRLSLRFVVPAARWLVPQMDLPGTRPDEPR